MHSRETNSQFGGLAGGFTSSGGQGGAGGGWQDRRWNWRQCHRAEARLLPRHRFLSFGFPQPHSRTRRPSLAAPLRSLTPSCPSTHLLHPAYFFASRIHHDSIREPACAHARFYPIHVNNSFVYRLRPIRARPQRTWSVFHHVRWQGKIARWEGWSQGRRRRSATADLALSESWSPGSAPRSCFLVAVAHDPVRLPLH